MIRNDNRSIFTGRRYGTINEIFGCKKISTFCSNILDLYKDNKTIINSIVFSVDRSPTTPHFIHKHIKNRYIDQFLILDDIYCDIPRDRKGRQRYDAENKQDKAIKRKRDNMRSELIQLFQILLSEFSIVNQTRIIPFEYCIRYRPVLSKLYDFLYDRYICTVRIPILCGIDDGNSNMYNMFRKNEYCEPKLMKLIFGYL